MQVAFRLTPVIMYPFVNTAVTNEEATNSSKVMMAQLKHSTQNQGNSALFVRPLMWKAISTTTLINP